MPWLEIKERGLRMFCIINSEIPLRTQLESTPPESKDLDPSKPNLIFIHAACCSSASFTAQFSDRRLSNAFNLIALDARLCGRTEGTPRTTHVLEDSSYCLTAALDQLDLPNYSLVGEDFHGCNCATWIAIKRPEKVKSLCLISPGWLKEPPATVQAMCKEWLPHATSNKDGKGDGTGRIPEDAMQVVSDYYFGKMNREPERRAIFIEAFEKRYGAGHSSHDIRHLISMFDREPIPADLVAGINAPVLILQGTDDAVASPMHAAEEWRARFTGGELSYVFANLQDPSVD
ncbi:alpha/beta-hydrolase [Meredithblackwellia eburnea MCA 4105]